MNKVVTKITEIFVKVGTHLVLLRMKDGSQSTGLLFASALYSHRTPEN
jgi:hypothetical protein